METSINLFYGRIAASRARSLLAYPFDMWLRHNLKVSLRRNSLCSFSRRSHSPHLNPPPLRGGGGDRSFPLRGKVRMRVGGSLRFIP